MNTWDWPTLPFRREQDRPDRRTTLKLLLIFFFFLTNKDNQPIQNTMIICAIMTPYIYDEPKFKKLWLFNKCFPHNNLFIYVPHMQTGVRPKVVTVTASHDMTFLIDSWRQNNINIREERKEVGADRGFYLEDKMHHLPHLPCADWYAFRQYWKVPCAEKWRKKRRKKDSRHWKTPQTAPFDIQLTHPLHRIRLWLKVPALMFKNYIKVWLMNTWTLPFIFQS